MKSFISLAAAAVLLAGTASAAVVEFDTNNGAALTHGSFVENAAFDFGNGLTGTITTNSNGAVNKAQIYSADTIGGRDPDLEQPTLVGNPGVTYDGGNMLIIAENNNPNTPDDEGKGGTIEFVFDTLVRFTGITLIDGEEGANEITVTTDNGAVLDSVFQGHDKFDAYQFNEFTKSITVTFGRSGALDRLVVQAVPVPAGLGLMLTAFGGLAFLRRRRG